ncbi:MAG: hypothetical protein IT379_05835 [Deltaproteobacteria bacterium]|nr:hypothetical protein [Deltaproteobacteria bacterium]
MPRLQSSITLGALVDLAMRRNLTTTETVVTFAAPAAFGARTSVDRDRGRA